MTYDILIAQIDEVDTVPVQQVTVTIRDDEGAVVLNGETTVCGSTEDAQEYGMLFLTDLRTNFRRIANMQFDWEVPADPPSEEPTAEPAMTAMVIKRGVAL